MVAEITGMEPTLVGRAVRALSPRFIRIEETMGGIMDASLRAAAETLGGFGRDLLINVAAKPIRLEPSGPTRHPT
jgi:hypothetical protein